MRFRTTARRLLGASMVVALLATLSVDGLLVSRHIDHERKLAAARAERKAERVFLQQLQSVALDVGRAASPVATVLVALGEFRPGDIYAARDALARGRALRAIITAESRLKALHPPKALRAMADELAHDVDDMRTSTLELGSHGAVTDFEALSGALNGDSATTFETAIGDFTGTLQETYARQKLRPPLAMIGPGSLDGPSATDWIFGADRACVAADLAVAPTEKYLNSRALPALEELARIWVKALNGVATTFAHLRQPQGSDALPLAIRTRLSVLRASQAAFQQELTAVERHDPSGVLSSLTRIFEIVPALAQLSKALRAYGAVACGNIMDAWAGVKHKASTTPTSA